MYLGDIYLKNPYLLAAGPAKYGRGYAPHENPLNCLMFKSGLIRPERFGGVMTKTITIDPRAGNYRWYRPDKVLRRIRGGWANRFGWNNIGIREFRDREFPKSGLDNLIPSVGALKSPRELLVMISMLNKLDILAIEWNVSCPHVDIFFRNNMKIYENSLKEMVKASRHPLIVKLGPAGDEKSLDEIARNSGVGRIRMNGGGKLVIIMAQIARQCGVSAVSLINTVSAYIPGFGDCGLSGPIIKRLALETVAQVVRATGMPVIGIGGIETASDCRDFFNAGASAVAFSSVYLPKADIIRHWKRLAVINQMLTEAKER